MILGKVSDLFIPRFNVFDLASPMRKHVSLRITAYVTGRPDHYCQSRLTGVRGQLVAGRCGWYLVLKCQDGQKRSFGEGTRIEFHLPTAAV